MRKKSKPPELIPQLIKEYERLKEAEALLEEVWIALGPYSQAVENPTMIKLQNFFGFDDSE